MRFRNHVPVLAVISVLSLGKVRCEEPTVFPLEPQLNFEIGEEVANSLLNFSFKDPLLVGTGSQQVEFRMNGISVDIEPDFLKIKLDAVLRYDLLGIVKTYRFRYERSITEQSAQINYHPVKKKITISLQNLQQSYDANLPTYVKDQIEQQFSQFTFYPLDLLDDFGRKLADGTMQVSESFPIRFADGLIVGFVLEKDIVKLTVAPKFEIETVFYQLGRIAGAEPTNYGNFTLISNVRLRLKDIRISDLGGTTKSWSEEFNTERVASSGFPRFIKSFTLFNSMSQMSGQPFTFRANITNQLTNMHIKGKYFPLTTPNFLTLQWK